MRDKHHWLLWPGLLAIGPLAIVLVYLAQALHLPVTLGAFKDLNEIFAVMILGVIFTALVIRSARQHNLLYWLLGGFALIAWLREIHFEWTHKGVYILLLILISLVWWWRERLKPLAQAGVFLPWFKGTMVIYLLSVLISRRVFRGLLPDEELMHTALEEVLENVAHSMLLITAGIGDWRRTESSASAPQPGPN